MTHRKVFRFRLKPNTAQRQALERNAGSRRFIWNWALARKQHHYREYGVGLRTSVLQAELPILKRTPGMEWLAEVDSQSLQVCLQDLDHGYRNFFEKRARFPRFKSRKRDEARFCIPQRVTVADGRVYIPKTGWVPIWQSQPVECKTNSATFKRDVCGNWYVTLVSEFEMPDTQLPVYDPSNVVGIDLGLKTFAVLSDGEQVASPKFFRKRERKLRRAQRVFSRREMKSNRRTKAKRAVALVQRKTANQRQDFLHKLTTELVVKYDGICIEDLCVKGIARTKRAKSTYDAAWGEFRRQLEYKTVWQRKHLAVINRWYPSSKTCSTPGCGWINRELTEKDREWDCQQCGVHHDRDFNAATNIKSEGLKLLAVGHGRVRTSLSKREHGQAKRTARAGVRLPQVEAVGVEA